MPLKIRWTKKEYLGTALMLFGGCGLFQLFFIFVAQYYLSIGNYVVIILIPIGVTFGLFYCSTIIFDSYAQVDRRKKIKTQFEKSGLKKKKSKKILNFPVSKPLLIIYAIFIPGFFISYFICNLFLNNIISFMIAENLPTIVSFFVANLIEKNYAKVQRI